MKTEKRKLRISTFINKFTDETVKQKALLYTKENNMLNYRVKDASSALLWAFNWAKTPEGDSFWKSVYRAINSNYYENFKNINRV